MASGSHVYQLHDKIKLFANKVGPFGSRAPTPFSRARALDYASLARPHQLICLRKCEPPSCTRHAEAARAVLQPRRRISSTTCRSARRPPRSTRRRAWARFWRETGW